MLTPIVEQLIIMNQHHAARNVILTEQNSILADIRDDVRVLRVRAETEELGLYLNRACWDQGCESNVHIIRRALVENGLMNEDVTYATG